jgi:hypothetical protein
MVLPHRLYCTIIPQYVSPNLLNENNVNGTVYGSRSPDDTVDWYLVLEAT